MLEKAIFVNTAKKKGWYKIIRIIISFTNSLKQTHQEERYVTNIKEETDGREGQLPNVVAAVWGTYLHAAL